VALRTKVAHLNMGQRSILCPASQTNSNNNQHLQRKSPKAIIIRLIWNPTFPGLLPVLLIIIRISGFTSLSSSSLGCSCFPVFSFAVSSDTKRYPRSSQKWINRMRIRLNVGSFSSQRSTSHWGAVRNAAPWSLTCSGPCQGTTFVTITRRL
jgi:hypothetical protein